MTDTAPADAALSSAVKSQGPEQGSLRTKVLQGGVYLFAPSVSFAGA